MKLKQTEYCHHCDRHIEFEFEDTTLRQVIICPNCGHEHYRELDEGTITNIRIHAGCQEIRFAKMPDLNIMVGENELITNEPLETEMEIKKVIGRDGNGNAILEGNGRTISQRRWGRDPRQ